MVQRHQPVHLRGELSGSSPPPQGPGDPANQLGKSPPPAKGLGKTSARGLHFRQASYLRRHPLHTQPAGTLRASPALVAALSLPAAIGLMGLPGIAAPTPQRLSASRATRGPVQTSASKRAARSSPKTGTFTSFVGLEPPFAGADYPFGGTDRARPYPNRLEHARVRLGAPGLVAAFGDAPFFGAPGERARDIVGVTLSRYGRGYWAVDSRGAVFSYGDAHFLGSLSNDHRSRQIAGIAATPTGRGYWLVSKDGDIFSFGDARFYGSLGRARLKKPVVGIAPLPNGRGYWLVTADGGVYTFGDARFYGSLGKTLVKQPVIGIAASPSGHGYWVATARGGVFSFGDARFHGSLSASHLTVTAIAAARGPRQGYWLLAAGGNVHGFGAARDLGSATTGPGVRATALAPTPDGAGYVIVTMGLPLSARHLSFLGDFLVTCYDLTGPTRSGEMAGPQSAAVDPGVIPLGTQIYVQGVGERTADDTGGAIVGDHVDIWEPSFGECATWGDQQRAVYRVIGG